MLVLAGGSWLSVAGQAVVVIELMFVSLPMWSVCRYIQPDN
jgi:hypothetical protein